MANIAILVNRHQVAPIFMFRSQQLRITIDIYILYVVWQVFFLV